jgi:hypothetical protein
MDHMQAASYNAKVALDQFNMGVSELVLPKFYSARRAFRLAKSKVIAKTSVITAKLGKSLTNAKIISEAAVIGALEAKRMLEERDAK